MLTAPSKSLPRNEVVREPTNLGLLSGGSTTWPKCRWGRFLLFAFQCGYSLHYVLGSKGVYVYNCLQMFLNFEEDASWAKFDVPIGFFSMLMGTIPMMGHVLARISNRPTTRPPRLSCPRAVEGHQPAIDPHLSREKGWCFFRSSDYEDISYIYICVSIYTYIISIYYSKLFYII